MGNGKPGRINLRIRISLSSLLKLRDKIDTLEETDSGETLVTFSAGSWQAIVPETVLEVRKELGS